MSVNAGPFGPTGPEGWTIHDPGGAGITAFLVDSVLGGDDKDTVIVSREQLKAVVPTMMRLTEEVADLRRTLAAVRLHSLLKVRAAAFGPKIGVRYTEEIRGAIADELRIMEDDIERVLRKGEIDATQPGPPPSSG